MCPVDTWGHGSEQASSGSPSLVGQEDKPRATSICCGAHGDHSQALRGPPGGSPSPAGGIRKGREGVASKTGPGVPQQAPLTCHTLTPRALPTPGLTTASQPPRRHRLG